MNDIEQLIAGLPRPSPSADLDSRIADLARHFRSGGRAPHDKTGFAVSRMIVALASTAVAGLLGFVIGRYSAPVVAGQPLLQSTATAASKEEHAGMIPVGSPSGFVSSALPARNRMIVSIQVSESEALARFVMPSKRSARLFGNGPLHERSEPSQIE